MRHLRIIVILLLSFYTVNSFSQDDSKSLVMQNNNAIIFSPLNLLDPINPSFQFGYQRLFNNKYELQMEYGHIINKALFHYIFNPNEDRDEYSNEGYKVRMELKRYYKIGHVIKYYVSGELFYLENNSKVQNQFIASDNNLVYTDYFSNLKTKYGINVKVGIKIIVDALFFESYIGTGIAYRNNIHNDRKNINDKPYDTSFLNDNIPKEMYIINMPLNLKVGYMF